jgi:ribonuclease J
MADPVRVTFLGGLGEIGRNCFCVEVDGRIIVVDLGIMFPTSDMPGVDLVLPDLSYLFDNADRLDAVVLTHGHEDHTGGLSHLLKEVEVPIYGTALTLGLAKGRLEEARVMGNTELRAVDDGAMVRIGPIDVQFIPVTHSVPHACGLAFHTPQGTIVHTGDFKLDHTPVDGRTTDLGLLGALGRSGVRLLLSDSTNAEHEGWTGSESSVGASIRSIFARSAGKRIVTACFSSHLHRVQQLAQAAIDEGRKVAFLGRSMGNNVTLARSMGIFDVSPASVVDISEVGGYDPGDVAVICTGSQGEPLSALSLMAAGESRWLKIGSDDVVVISASPIPGNETNVMRTIDGLYRLGAEVVHSGNERGVHVSGHASREELKTMLSLVAPQSFTPVHGEYRHLVDHARIAERVGIRSSDIGVCEDGDAVVLADGGTFVEKGVAPSHYVYVDGIAGDLGHGVLRDRRILAEEGVVVVVVAVDHTTGEVVHGPDLETKGWIHDAEVNQLAGEASAHVRAILEQAMADGTTDPEGLRRTTRTATARFIQKATRQRPVVIPVVVEV